MIEVDLGKVYLPEKMIEIVEKHKQSMLEEYKNTYIYGILESATFSMWFSDFMYKNSYWLLDFDF